MTSEWQRRLIAMAEFVSRWSKDPSTQVGVVITNKDKQILGIGYNGFPRGVCDYPQRYNDRPTKYAMVVHGEVNAILNATGDLHGAHLFFWPFLSCSTCTGVVIQAGVKTVYYPVHADDSPWYDVQQRWQDSTDISRTMYREAGVRIVEIPFFKGGRLWNEIKDSGNLKCITSEAQK